MIDPAREEVKPALEIARRAGIRTIMITGRLPQYGKSNCDQHWAAATRAPGDDWRPVE